MSSGLPINAIKPEVLAAWQRGGCIVSAPPGSGKSTQLPLWGLSLPYKKIYLLIPKRIAVKLAANQLASNLQQSVGETVGYQLRQDSCLSDHTRIVVTSYGSFLQMLLNDPEAVANSTVIMDEFHERAIDQDVSFALIQEALSLIDDPIALIIMSATLEVDQLKNITGLPLITSPGFSHPIDIQYKKLAVNNSLEFARFIQQTWQGKRSHLLVFLPGLKEIRAIERHLDDKIPRLILHGQLNNTPDLNVLQTAPPTVILATNIAESSVTLANVHTVIDSGLERFVTTHPITGITTLKTRQISQASATQRAGRSGRLGPGLAIRLWSAEEHKSKVPYQPAEITQVDLTQCLLQLAFWGARIDQVQWLTPPDKNRVEAALQKCAQWGALENARITSHGEAMLKTGLEPTLANFVVSAQHYHCLPAAIGFAAALSVNPELASQAYRANKLISHAEIKKEAQRLSQRLDQPVPTQFTPLNPIPLIQAFQQRLIYSPNEGSAKLHNGAAVSFANPIKNTWSLMLEGHQNDRGLRVFHALPLESSDVENNLKVEQTLQFRPGQPQEFWRIESIGNIVLTQKPVRASEEQKCLAWENYIAQQGEAALPASPAFIALKQRWLTASAALPDWPAWPAETEWLALIKPFLNGLTSLSKLETLAAFKHWAGYERLTTLDSLCPKTWLCPTGRTIELDYKPEHNKVIARLKLQEAFGLRQQPLVANSLAITLELTAPNGRPVANVHDIPYFWQQVYPEVRKELRGRYAKHPWPEDPLNFQATAKTNRQLRST